jgi:hypothetical protein
VALRRTISLLDVQARGGKRLDSSEESLESGEGSRSSEGSKSSEGSREGSKSGEGSKKSGEDIGSDDGQTHDAQSHAARASLWRDHKARQSRAVDADNRSLSQAFEAALDGNTPEQDGKLKTLNTGLLINEMVLKFMFRCYYKLYV